MLSPLPEQTLLTILNGLAAQDSFVFLETSKTSPDNRFSYLFLNLLTTLSCPPECPPQQFLHEAQAYLDQGFYLAGWFAYEFGYALEPVLNRCLQDATAGGQPLAVLGVFPAPIVYDHLSHGFSSALPFAKLEASLPPAAAFEVSNLVPAMSRQDYLKGLRRIKAYIEAGDTYQVNYTLKLLFDFAGSPEALYRSLRHNQPVSHSAYLKLGDCRILSFSPELFFHKTGAECTVKPMKGTMLRGRTLAEDREQAALLQQDPKNRSENVMIVDLLRNDLGRLCQLGTVATSSMFEVETYATLHQMTSTIHGTLHDQVDLTALFQALFPCGSVTGAPKIRTMEIIHALEAGPRGVYTGGLGFISPNGDARFNVPIRTVLLTGDQGEMGIGAGIVHDSDPEAEWRECLLKGRFLSNPVPDFQLIETMLAEPGKGIWLLDLHLSRLSDSASYFGFPMDSGSIKRGLRQVTEAEPGSAVRIRLLLFKDGHHEISLTPCDSPTQTDLPLLEKVAGLELPTVKISRFNTDSSSPLLFHKTSNRALYDAERAEALAEGFQEVIFCNEKEEVTEGSITSIFLRQGEDYYTPPLDCGLLPSVFRRYLLEKYPRRVLEKKLTIQELKEAGTFYIANSVRGIRPVTL